MLLTDKLIFFDSKEKKPGRTFVTDCVPADASMPTRAGAALLLRLVVLGLLAAVGWAHALIEDPFYYCDACVTTLEEFHWALQDGVTAQARQRASTEMRLDMVDILGSLCDKWAAGSPARVGRYREDIIDGCEQIAQTNSRPLILEFTGSVSLVSLLHERTNNFCVQKLGVCPAASGVASVVASECDQCVLIVKDMWGVVNRVRSPSIDIEESAKQQQSHATKAAAKRVRADVWDALERTCDGLVARYHDATRTGIADACSDFLADYDTDIVDAISAHRTSLLGLEATQVDLGQFDAPRGVPTGSKVEDDLLREAVFGACYVTNICSASSTSDTEFTAAFQRIHASPWLAVRVCVCSCVRACVRA